MATQREIIDGLTSDIENNVALPSHVTRKYVEPVLLRPDLGSLLAVYASGEASSVQATSGEYEDAMEVVVMWCEPRLSEIDAGGAEDETIAGDALDTIEKIVTRIKTWATAVPGIDDQGEADLVKTESGILEGSGSWAWRATVEVRQWT